MNVVPSVVHHVEIFAFVNRLQLVDDTRAQSIATVIRSIAHPVVLSAHNQRPAVSSPSGEGWPAFGRRRYFLIITSNLS